MTTLGRDLQGNNIEITQTHRLNSMYVIGANGMGKTTMLENMIIEDISIGMGLAVLDPHGDLINNIIRRMPENRLEDVILFDPILLAEMGHYVGLNLFECHNMNSPKAVEFAVEQVVQIFSKVFGMSVETPRLNQYVRNIAYTFVGTGYTMVDIPPLLLEKNFRDKVLTNGTRNLFWKSYDELRPSERLERSESTLDRIDTLISNSIIRNIVGQSYTSINFRDIMDKGKILLVSLSAQYESLTSLLGSIIIAQLLSSALSRAASQTKRRQFNLYADEYQRFSTPDFATLLTEARKFGIATTIAHQVRAQLDEKNAATALQAGSLVVFRVTSEDAKELANSFNLVPPTEIIERPIRAPAQNVLETLINRGSHENPKVNEFVQKYLRPLTQATGDRVDKNSADYEETYEVLPRKTYPEGSYGYDPRLIRQELNTLNIMLFDSMTGVKYKNNEGPDVIRLCAAFGMYLGFSHFYIHKDIPNLRPWDIRRQFYLMNYYLDRDEKMPPERYLDLMAQLSSQQFHVTKDNMPLDFTYFYTTLPVTSDVSHMRMVARDIMQAEKIRAEAFMETFFGILDGVAKSPVMIDSGKIEKIEQASTTFADRSNAIANELTQLKKGHARIKLQTGEYLLITIVPESNKKDFEAKKQRIIDNTRKKYCKPRSIVEEEIRRRQTVEEQPPSITRKHQV